MQADAAGQGNVLDRRPPDRAGGEGRFPGPSPWPRNTGERRQFERELLSVYLLTVNVSVFRFAHYFYLFLCFPDKEDAIIDFI